MPTSKQAAQQMKRDPGKRTAKKDTTGNEKAKKKVLGK